MSIPKLQRTKNYSQFFYTKENRDVDILHLKPQHKALRESMQQYGFLPAFPLMVRTQNGRFAVVDGQHRLTFAKELGLEVFFVIDDKDVNISAVNQAQANWSPKDYANRWAHAGRPDYVEAIAFANEHNAPLVLAFAMLAGTTTSGNIMWRVKDGSYQIKARELAHRVMSIYRDLTAVNSKAKGARLIEALWACCHVDYFDESRLIETVSRRPGLLSQAGTRDAYLDALTEIYNFGRKAQAPLRFDAEQAMRNRKDSFGKSSQ
jgi:hypothetical protein